MFSFSTGTAPGEGVGSRTLYGIAFGPLTVPEAEQQTDHSRNMGGDDALNEKILCFIHIFDFFVVRIIFVLRQGAYNYTKRTPVRASRCRLQR